MQKTACSLLFFDKLNGILIVQEEDADFTAHFWWIVMYVISFPKS